MALSLREQLINRTDARERDYVLKCIQGDPVTVTVRRFGLGERDELIKKYKLGTKQSQEEASASAIQIVAQGMVPALTEQEVRELPAAVVDEVAQSIMDFNGWTERGKAELSDQFRATNGSAV